MKRQELLKKQQDATDSALLKQKDADAKQEDVEAMLRAQLLEKQREILLLHQKRLDIELEEAKSRLKQQEDQCNFKLVSHHLL